MRVILAALILLIAATSSSAANLAAGYNFTFSLKSDGTAWAWGDNWNGQLGDGTTYDRRAPVPVTGIAGVTAIAGGGAHAVAIKSDGTVWTWGDNWYGQLGDGKTVERHAPVQVTGIAGVTAVDGGWLHTIALKSDGTVWTWGGNYFGQLGDGTFLTRLSPVPVPVTGSVVTLTAILAGTGGGSIHSNPPGLSCSSGTCTASVPADSPVTLMATPDVDSIFAGWSGGGCSGQSDCTVNVSVNTTVNAVFDYVVPVKLQGGMTYPTLAEAYAAANDGDTILVRATAFTGDLVLNRNISVTFKGGYDAAFARNTGQTILNGKLILTRGAARFESITVKVK